MGAECPYLAMCSRITSIQPDQVTAATEVLQEVVEKGIPAIRYTWKGESWISTNELCVVPLGNLNAVAIVCNGQHGGFYEGKIYFKGILPAEGQIGGMATKDGVFALEYAASEVEKCLRYQQFANNG